MSKLGATGEFPEGKLDETDEGGLVFSVSHTTGLVRVDFGKPVAWLAFPPEVAFALATKLVEHAKAAKHGG